MRLTTNNIGVLRLGLALLVIIGHAPELIDGNRSREPLTTIFGSMSFGELAVDAFFLLSGYLITQSMIDSKSVKNFMLRRIFRIYPAFIVAYMASVFILGPIVGAKPWEMLPKTLARLVALTSPPKFPGQLPGLPYPELNGAVWTIAYEFRCYLIVALLGMVGWLFNRRWVLGTTIAAIGALILQRAYSHYNLDWPIADISSSTPAKILAIFLGNPADMLRFSATFLVGMCFCLFRDQLMPMLTRRMALICTLVTAALLYRNPILAEPALITFGACSLFWLAFKANLGPLQSINTRWDISYGVYLYGWPLSTYLIWQFHISSPILLAALTIPLAIGLGAASWWGIERSANAWARARTH